MPKAGGQATYYVRSLPSSLARDYQLRGILCSYVPFLFLTHQVLMTASRKRKKSTKPKDVSSADFISQQLNKLSKELSPDYVTATLNGITEATKKLNLTLNDSSHELLKKSRLSDNAHVSYLKHLRGLFRFLVMIGDYESILIFSNQKQRHIMQSMSAKNIALYMLYKTNKKDTLLKPLDGGEEIKDIVTGETIKCAGGWNSIENADQFLSTITNIHKVIGQSGSYSEPCPDCVKLYLEKKTTCEWHFRTNKVHRSGNPRVSDEVEDAWRQCKINCSDHIVKKCYQILPSEVQRIRDYLLSTNKMEDYQIYVMMLVAIHLFLRFDEISALRCEHFLSDEFSSITPEGKVNMFVIKIKAKMHRDTWQYLVLWRYDDVPTLCPVRHLLLYLYLRDINEGYVFPNFNDSSRFDYHKFNDICKNKLTPIIGKEEKMTSHLYRTTGYLFAILGGGDLNIIRKAARHKTMTIALAYFQDAETKRMIINLVESFDPANQVPKWKVSYLERNHSNASALDGASPAPLQELAKTFTNVAFGNNSAIRDQLHNLSCFLKQFSRFKPNLSPMEEMQLACSDCTPEVKRRVLAVFSRHISVVRNVEGTTIPVNVAATNDGRVRTHGSTSKVTANNNMVSNQIITSNNRNIGGKKTSKLDFPIRKEIKNISCPMERLDKLLLFFEEVSSVDKNELSSGARSFYYSAAIPVQKCLTAHFNSNREAFVRKWGNPDLYRFPKKCCNGSGRECSVTK